MIELSRDDAHLLEIKKIEMREENCEWCRSRRMCKYFCVCKEVWYCSQMCKMKDTNYHENRCSKRMEQQSQALNTTSELSKKGLVGKLILFTLLYNNN